MAILTIPKESEDGHNEAPETPADDLTPKKVGDLQQQGPRQTFVPLKDFQKSEKGWNSAAGVRVIYPRGIRRITLQRYLVALIVHDIEEFPIKDLLILYDNLCYLQELCERDPGFSQKFGKTLEALAVILKKSRMFHTPTQAGFKKLSLELKNDLKGFYYDKRNLKDIQTKVISRYKIEIRQGQPLGTPTDNLPIKRYIGIGYRDKGTARNPAKDGVPTWKEYMRWRLWEALE